MTLQLEKNVQIPEETHLSNQNQREQVKQEIQRRINEALQIAKDLAPNDCLSEVRDRLLAVQLYCESVGKTFIFVEERITTESRMPKTNQV